MLNSLILGIGLHSILFPLTASNPGAFGLKHGLSTPRLCTAVLISLFKYYDKNLIDSESEGISIGLSDNL